MNMELKSEEKINKLNEDFAKSFKHLLTAAVYKRHQFQRWPGFEFIAKELFSKKRPVKIIETGTMKTEYDWLGYGQSTAIWDYIVDKIGGEVYSVDIEMDTIKFARTKCKHVQFVHCDSVGFLRGFDASKVDLLYLDSYDWTEQNHISSCLHHMGELAMVWDKLPSGCLIVVDDAHNKDQGKHVLVHLFFQELLNLKPFVSCHIEVWRKP